MNSITSQLAYKPIFRKEFWGKKETTVILQFIFRFLPYMLCLCVLCNLFSLTLYLYINTFLSHSSIKCIYYCIIYINNPIRYITLSDTVQIIGIARYN